MNRIVLLGNGFDLAHGMKTSYSDFIKWYISKAIDKGKGHGYTDALIKVERAMDYRGTPQPYISYEEIYSWVHYSYENGLDFEKIGIPVVSFDGTEKYPFILSCNSNLFQNLIKHCAVRRWVDVEAIFYDTLVTILELPISNQWDKEPQLIELNKAMLELIQRLRDYLLTIEPPEPISGYRNIIGDKIWGEDIESARQNFSGLPYTSALPEKTMIVNFNYTSTFDIYYDERGRTERNIELNYINGNLTDEDNPIIFGFGDELDRRYKNLEEESSRGWFEFIKSFKYLRTLHYQDLIRFADGEEYQVIILGHSCGLSDRTMLHMLFEHDNCRSIKIYYYGEPKDNNYTETTYEMARHFNDKALMRKRIVKLPHSARMHQFNDE